MTSDSLKLKARRILAESPYTIELTSVTDGSDGWSARIREFDGCFASGKTSVEAGESVIDVALSWLETQLAQNGEIPSADLFVRKP